MTEELPEELAARQKKAEIVMAYKRLFESADGKIVLEDMAREFGWDQPCFVANPSNIFDPYFAAVRDGQRRVKLRIDSALNQPSIPDGNVKPRPKVIK